MGYTKKRGYWVMIDVMNSEFGVFRTKKDVSERLGLHRNSIRDGGVYGMVLVRQVFLDEWVSWQL